MKVQSQSTDHVEHMRIISTCNSSLGLDNFNSCFQRLQHLLQILHIILKQRSLCYQHSFSGTCKPVLLPRRNPRIHVNTRSSSATVAMFAVSWPEPRPFDTKIDQLRVTASPCLHSVHCALCTNCFGCTDDQSPRIRFREQCHQQ